LPASYFIASKIEAFKSRGQNDEHTSTDFEDIVFVLDHTAFNSPRSSNYLRLCWRYLKYPSHGFVSFSLNNLSQNRERRRCASPPTTGARQLQVTSTTAKKLIVRV